MRSNFLLPSVPHHVQVFCQLDDCCCCLTQRVHLISGLSEQGSEAVASPADLPEHVIVAMLRRETLLTSAKLDALRYDQTMGERQLRKLDAELHQVGSAG